jgi:hypothetical protein
LYWVVMNSLERCLRFYLQGSTKAESDQSNALNLCLFVKHYQVSIELWRLETKPIELEWFRLTDDKGFSLSGELLISAMIVRES